LHTYICLYSSFIHLFDQAAIK